MHARWIIWQRCHSLVYTQKSKFSSKRFRCALTLVTGMNIWEKYAFQITLCPRRGLEELRVSTDHVPATQAEPESSRNISIPYLKLNIK